MTIKCMNIHTHAHIPINHFMQLENLISYIIITSIQKFIVLQLLILLKFNFLLRFLFVVSIIHFIPVNAMFVLYKNHLEIIHIYYQRILEMMCSFNLS